MGLLQRERTDFSIVLRRCLRPGLPGDPLPELCRQGHKRCELPWQLSMCDYGTLQQAGFRKASTAIATGVATSSPPQGLVPQGRRACDGGGPTAAAAVLMGWMADGRTNAEPEESPDVEDPKRCRGPSPPPNSLSSCAWSTWYVKTLSQQHVDRSKRRDLRVWLLTGMAASASQT